MNNIMSDIHDMFYKSEFKELIEYIREINSKGINSYEISFFMMASLLAINDIFGAKSYCMMNEFLNSSEVKQYFNEDISTYSLIKENTDLNLVSCLILYTFITMYEVKDLDRKQLILEFYEMIDTIYSLGYDNNVIEYLVNNSKFIFNEI